mmetsp:Transcript_38388/g.91038  ORF Transcript_38388/g.91038 Transcript_38388/m.91038 type:complete len:1229 (+) Transcript_38388:203-3889(+)
MQLRGLSASQKKALAAAILLGGGGAAFCHYLQRAKHVKQWDPRTRRRKHASGLDEILPLLVKSAGPQLISIVALSASRTLLSNRLADLQGRLFEAAFLARTPVFLRRLVENLCVCALASAVESTIGSVIEGTKLRWRGLLTERLHRRYFSGMVYYQLNQVDRSVDSPEQRVCEDVPALCNGLGDLVQEWVVSAVDAAFYAHRLKRYMGTHAYTVALAGYVLGVGAASAALSPPFGKLFKRLAGLEAAHRSLHSRLLRNSEPVALYGGVDREGAAIDGAFRRVMSQRHRLAATQWSFGVVQDFLLKYLASTVAVALIIGPFFRGSLRPGTGAESRAAMLRHMRYHTSVIIALFGAMGALGSSGRKLMKLGAHADRVAEMERAMKRLAAERQGHSAGIRDDPRPAFLETDGEISFAEATVVTPADTTLVRDLTLRIPAGTNLLVTGPNGSGKSSLFRVLGGLWPLARGQIGKPGASTEGLCADIFYVPQRPYVTVGTLQEQLIYPLQLPSDGTDVISVEEQRELLKSVDLEGLMQRRAPREVVDWGHELSLGEQQRLGMARLFYHKPRFAILDECTSGVTVEMEERFCRAVAELGCTCVTISHRPALVAFHDMVLSLDGEGGWSVLPGRRRQQEMAAAGKHPVHSDGAEGGTETAGEASGKLVEAGGTGPLVLARAPSEPSGPVEGFLERIQFSCSPERVGGLSAWRALRAAALEAAPVLSHILSHSRPREVSALAAVLLARTALQDRIASLNGRSVDLVLQQDWSAFVRLIGVSVLQSSASAVIAPTLKYLTEKLSLDWCESLTAAISSQYLRGHSFYAVQNLVGIHDADQRITRDVKCLSEELAGLVQGMVKPMIDLAWFSRQMYSLTGTRGLLILYAYIVLSSAGLRVLTPDLRSMAETEAQLEGDLQTVHARLRAHAESVAFFGGGHREGSLISWRFAELCRHLRRSNSLKWGFLAADDFFARQLPNNATWALTLIYSLKQRSEGRGAGAASQGALVHDMRYLSSVVSHCLSAFGELLALQTRVARLRGRAVRVAKLMQALELVPPGQGLTDPSLGAEVARGGGSEGSEGAVSFRGVDVVTPRGGVLARRLSFEVLPGDNLLITGPNGSGKSSIARLLARLWPVHRGIILPGSRMRPGPQRPLLLFVPQKPYTSTASLREQFVYPLSLDEALDQEPSGGSSREERLQHLDGRLMDLARVVKCGSTSPLPPVPLSLPESLPALQCST